MRSNASILLFLALLFSSASLFNATSMAEVQTMDYVPDAGVGSDNYDYPLMVGQGWPINASGNTCGHTEYYSHSGCLGFGSCEDVIYGFYSPLGKGTAKAIAYSYDTYDPMVFAPYDNQGFDSSPCPYNFQYIGTQVDFEVHGPGELHRVVVDGSFYDEICCGSYYLEVSYTPVQLGRDGNRGTGGTGGSGGLSGGGGIPCEAQNGADGFPGGSGHGGGTGGNGGDAQLVVNNDKTLYNSSELDLGGLRGLTGPTGAPGSTGGQGGGGGAPFANGGAGAEPSPDYQPDVTNGGYGGGWPSGTGGNGNNSGGGGGGGGSTPFVGGGYGAGGGPGAQGAAGEGSNGAAGAYRSQNMHLSLRLNDPFQVGGSGGQGGQGGQGGHGGGGGGGAGECWFNPQGAGGAGGPGGPGGPGGAGGQGGFGSILLTTGSLLYNVGQINIGRGDLGGGGQIILGPGSTLLNYPQGTITIRSNGSIDASELTASVQNHGTIDNPEPPLVIQGTYQSFNGTVTGTFVNQGTVDVHLTEPTIIGTFEDHGRTEVPFAHSSSNVLWNGQVVVQDQLVIGSDAVLFMRFHDNSNESHLVFGDAFDVITYPAGSLSGQYDNIETSLPLTQGVWNVVYGHDLGSGRQSVRLVYAQDVSPVGDSHVPTSFALTGVYPNPFNPMTTVSYELPRASVVDFRIYDLKGRLVWQSPAGQVEPAGHRSFQWRGADLQGQSVASGPYLIKMKAGEFEASRRMMLVR